MQQSEPGEPDATKRTGEPHMAQTTWGTSEVFAALPVLLLPCQYSTRLNIHTHVQQNPFGKLLFQKDQNQDRLHETFDRLYVHDQVFEGIRTLQFIYAQC